jgi:hypothetical protein
MMLPSHLCRHKTKTYPFQHNHKNESVNFPQLPVQSKASVLHAVRLHQVSHAIRQKNILHTYYKSSWRACLPVHAHARTHTHSNHKCSPVHSCALSPYPQVLQTHMNWFSRVYRHPELLSHQELEWNANDISSVIGQDVRPSFKPLSWYSKSLFLTLIL